MTSDGVQHKIVLDMKEQFARIALMFGDESVYKLMDSRVIVFGVGGVGSYAVEALARSGIGSIDLVDSDVVVESNINRQLYALHSTVGRAKVEVASERIHDINPDCNVRCHKIFYLPETSSMFDFSAYDYVVDCIDTVAGKIQIIENAKKAGTRVISSMGAGNKIDPTKFQVSDISRTSVDPLARVVRRELSKRNISDVKVVYSTEKPITPKEVIKKSPGSNGFVPSVCGLIIAGEVIKDLLAIQ